ncbi:hypothetical protein ACER0A_013015 [Haloimpatiens sp. FM7315]|uniref:hypothetical protein n=1 Tax=Haloimpatiens sp. FM7315 TaxID=3298609 RepID=UPI0035A33956
MSQYCLNIKGNINLSDYSNIYDYMQFVGQKDQLVINIKSKKDIDSDIIAEMLKNSDFNVEYEGGRNSETYCIKACRH